MRTTNCSSRIYAVPWVYMTVSFSRLFGVAYFFLSRDMRMGNTRYNPSCGFESCNTKLVCTLQSMIEMAVVRSYTSREKVKQIYYLSFRTLNSEVIAKKDLIIPLCLSMPRNYISGITGAERCRWEGFN